MFAGVHEKEMEVDETSSTLKLSTGWAPEKRVYANTRDKVD